MFVELYICVVVGDDVVFPAAKSKGLRTSAFLRVLKYSTGGVLEVICFFFLFYILGSLFFFFFFFAWHFFVVLFSISNFVKLLCLQPAKLYKLKHLSKVEVVANDPSGCTFTLVKFHDRRDLYVLVLDMFSVSGTEAICEASYRSLFWIQLIFFLKL